MSDSFTQSTMKNGNIYARAVIGGKPYEFVLEKQNTTSATGRGFLLAMDGVPTSVPVVVDWGSETIQIGRMNLRLPKEREQNAMDFKTYDRSGDTLRLSEVVAMTKLSRSKVQELARSGSIKIVKPGRRGVPPKGQHRYAREAAYDTLSVLEYMDTDQYTSAIQNKTKTNRRKAAKATPKEAPVMKPEPGPTPDVTPAPSKPSSRVKVTRSLAWHEGRVAAMLETLDGRAGDVIRTAWNDYLEAHRAEAGR